MENLIDYLDLHCSAPQKIKYFYHYTKLETLFNILGGNNAIGEGIYLRATHREYLNDPTEVLNGLNFQNELINMNPFIKTDNSQERFDKWKDTYIISFSYDGDSLPMWNYYAQKVGIAIGFKRFKSTSENDLVLRCQYNCQEILESISKCMENSEMFKYAAALLVYAPLILKNEAYLYEKEVRYIGTFDNEKISYQTKSNLIIPYKNVYFHKEQIDHIVISPTAEQNEVKISLKRFLNDKGLGQIGIKTSKIPFRDFK